MTQTRHSDAVWQAIRHDYLSGHSKPRLAEHYRVGESTIRDRARREGWRRCDQSAPPVAPIDAEPDTADDPEPMRPVVAAIADAYRQADVALRRSRPVEAQRYLSVARGFERLFANRGPLATALNAHWEGEADAWWLARHPPWPEGVHDADEARAELACADAELGALLTVDALDSAAMAQTLDRSSRLRFCLDLADGMSTYEADPPSPPDPPCETTERIEPGVPTNVRHPPACPEGPRLQASGSRAEAGSGCDMGPRDKPEDDDELGSGADSVWISEVLVAPPDPPLPPDPPCPEQGEIDLLPAPAPRPSLLDPPDWDRPIPEQIALLERRMAVRMGFGQPWDDVAEQIAALQAHAGLTAPAPSGYACPHGPPSAPPPELPPPALSGRA